MRFDVREEIYHKLTNLHFVLSYRCPSYVHFLLRLLFVPIQPIRRPCIVSSVHVHRYYGQRLRMLRSHLCRLVPIKLLRHQDAEIGNKKTILINCWIIFFLRTSAIIVIIIMTTNICKSWSTSTVCGVTFIVWFKCRAHCPVCVCFFISFSKAVFFVRELPHDPLWLDCSYSIVFVFDGLNGVEFTYNIAWKYNSSKRQERNENGVRLIVAQVHFTSSCRAKSHNVGVLIRLCSLKQWQIHYFYHRNAIRIQ